MPVTAIPTLRAESSYPDLVNAAQELARSHSVLLETKTQREFFARLERTARFLRQCYGTVAAAIARGEAIPPAEEWLIDNFHFIAEQIKAIEQDLPRKYYSELPSAGTGALRGYPRAFEMAINLTSYSDYGLSEEMIRDYVDAYQTISSLTMGELWAFAIFLRIVLLEDLSKLMERSEEDRKQDAEIQQLIRELEERTLSNEDARRFVKERLPADKDHRNLWTARFISQARSGSPKIQALAHSSEVSLIEAGFNIEELIRSENQEVAKTQVSTRNVVLSLRLLASIDWPKLVESSSVIDRILRDDPTAMYGQCDFPTRDRYRHVIEHISRRSRTRWETDVAQEAISLAREALQLNPEDLRRAHVGYYLISEGRKILESRVGFRPGLFLRLQKLLEEEHAFLSYQACIWLLTGFFIVFILQYMAAYTANPISLFITALLLFLPASSLGVTITNWLVTHSVPPVVLPKLEWKEGVPSEWKTIVVLPTLLSDSADIREAVSQLEIHYLANSDENLEFAVLSDYADSTTQTTPDDENLLSEALTAVARLNKRHPRYPENRFHLFHRRRLWNEGEGKWMGWERKRGKLEELNRLLLGTEQTSFLPARVPENVRFVITVDADTILPRDSIRKMIGTLAHPLNRPVIDPRTRQVKEGYGILQPRVSHTLTSANRSWFAKIVAGPSGIDPYTAAVSDLYQDLFQEASFVGKGIYDVRAFHDCLDRRFPENRLLSHDLIEGSYARTGLVTDVEIFDEHPSDYTAFMLRQHRWIRGDWQVAAWIGPRVPGPDGKGVKNTLSALNRWKLLDNLRRSLIPPTLFLMLSGGWTFLPGSPLFWNFVVLAILFTRNIVEVTSGLIFVTRSVSWMDHLKSHIRQSGLTALHFLLRVTFLAHETFVCADAIVRAIYRIRRRKRLLEWLRAAQVERLLKRHWSQYPEEMFGSVALTTFCSAGVFLLQSESITVASPFLFSWAVAPFIAYLSGKEIRRKKDKLRESGVRQFRSYARDIWRYFDTHVTEEDHWLPPDNFQEVPNPVIAHRTSPTNIAFSLLANLVAYDFGFIGLTDFLERTERTLNSLTRLNTFNGHLYNWYDTRSLQPLEPRYVSTVDSGNLAAALIVLKQFALTFPRTQVPFHLRVLGVADSLRKMLERSKTTKTGEQQRLIRELIAFLRRTTGTEDEADLLRWLNRVVLEMKPDGAADPEYSYWWSAVYRKVISHLADHQRPQDLKRRLLSVARECEELTREMDFRFLFDEARGLFSIGFNVTNGRLDGSYYDLLASEARLASFIAIAKGDVPQSHWFRMSRIVTTASGERVLASWSGSMFEYLLPRLFLRSDKHTLLEQTYEKIIRLQTRYGRRHNVPWGMSEAAFHLFDAAANYQYGPFGVPWLGLKRGLGSSLVVAPYATFLSALLHPGLAARNLEALKKIGGSGLYGFYESIDFTRAHLPEKQQFSVVRAYMAHHLGMSLAAIDNVLNQNILQKRFQSDPAIKSTALLLQERIPVSPRRSPVQVFDERPRLFRVAEPAVARAFDTPILYPPRTQLLSNGSLMTVVTTGGSGYSECNGVRLNRWREDATQDAWGFYCYIKDVRSGRYWSAGFQPTRATPSFYRVHFMEDRVEIHRRDESIECRMEIVVSPEDNTELRRLALVNTSSEQIELEVTSYSEPVLTHANSDLAHPAFSNLFVQTECSSSGVLTAFRRPRGPEEKEFWVAHCAFVEDDTGPFEYETDRNRFIGRNRTKQNPIMLESSARLSNTTGAVLDPILSLRCRVVLPPYSRRFVGFAMAAGNSREEVIDLAMKYRDARAVERAIEMSATHGQVLLRRLSISLEEAHLFQRILGRMIFSDLSLRPKPAVLERNVGTQKALWAFGISGDLPICLVRVEDATEMETVRQLLRAHEYWRIKGFKTDLVILNEYPSSYFQHLQDDLRTAIASGSHAAQDETGGVFLIMADQMSEQDRTLLRTVARVQIVAERGSLASQVRRSGTEEIAADEYTPLSRFPIEDPPVSIPLPERMFQHMRGGFTMDGKEYVIILQDGQTTPAPWCNVISNDRFGFQVSESGAGMTWAVNSRENRLTPWSNDAVCDPIDSALYIRDEESGKFWSVTPSPSRGEGTYVVHHGAGYTRFHYGGCGVEQELLMFVPPDRPVKILQVTLRNPSRRTRKLSITFYAELVLGVHKAQTAPFVVTAIDAETGALIATNSYNNEFANLATFLYVNDQKRTVSADRAVFLGPEGSVHHPAAMRHDHLTGRIGGGLDPCLAMQTKITLQPLSEQQVVFLFGQTAERKEIKSLIREFGERKGAERALVATQQFWDDLLGSLQIKTPDPSIDLLVNRWLLYQAYMSRFWSRSAFYQSGGAFGFRDQLQDCLAFVYSRPHITRNYLLYAASRQFVEGDVQHWWHQPTGRGVRTRCSDDLLWLPYCAAFYINITGDNTILDEQAPFLTGKALEPELSEEYFEPGIAEGASLYEHCIRAIEHSLRFGPHELPLIGSGDWNDGMNRLGIAGKGESVWLAWFLIKILNDFAPICANRSDGERAQRYRDLSRRLAKKIDETAWDGEWYRRAFDDAGTPVGSNQNMECKIDSIAQSWAVLSGAADPDKIQAAFRSVEKHLLKRDEQLMLLFTPPFHETSSDPGYIKSYLPGIRENGGQYNHAAIWVLCAYCVLRQPDKAYEILQMVNPITRTATEEMIEKYRLEPYAVAADIYSHEKHIGRGGWSWYTGSAAWLYRAVVEYILGFQLHGDRLTLSPCIPPEWPHFELRYRRGNELFDIHVMNPNRSGTSVKSVKYNGTVQAENTILIDKNERIHSIEVELG